MDRTLTIPFTWDQKDQEGQAEGFGGARAWVDGVEAVVTAVSFDVASGAGSVVFDANLAAGLTYLIDVALIDDDGTTGTKASTTYRYDDAGPTSPTLGQATSTPKP